MRVLVTGGAGLIGFHAAMYYNQKGAQVHVLDNLERSDLLGHVVSPERAYFNIDRLREKKIEWINGDVSNPEVFKFLDRYDYILHFAGQCGVPTSIENPRRDMEVNYLGTFNVLEFARKTGAAVAFASTNKVYPLHDVFVKNEQKQEWEFANRAWALQGFPVVSDLEGSRTPYGASKYAADVLCQEYAHTYGVRTGVFRMSCIYGPNQFGFAEQGWATWFIIACLKNLPITIYGDGDQTRDMLHVTDCVKAYDAFLSSELKHGVWNLGGGVNNTLTLNKHLRFMAQITDGYNPDITFADWRPSDQKCYVTDISKVCKDLKWEPTISPQQGLTDVAHWVNDNLGIF